MSEIANAKTLRDLEFERVKELVAGYAASPLGRARLSALVPTSQLERLTNELRSVEEMKRALQETTLSLGELNDLEPILDRARTTLTLEAEDFMQTLKTLQGARLCKGEIEKLQSDFPKLHALAKEIEVFTELEGAIRRTFDEEGELRDNASPLLRQLTLQKRLIEERLEKKLRAFLNAPQLATVIQEPVITRRSNRLVIPIKSALKGDLECVVHDSSDSGQTLYVEPISVVAENNEIRELDSQIRDEKLRILQDLTAHLKGEAPRIRETLAALGRLDSLYGRARYALQFDAHTPQINADGQIKLNNARHPLLDPSRVVPIDFSLDARHQGAVITGPNTGGKTVSLKTVGVLTLMAQAGIPIPADPTSEISLFEKIRSDIGDEQSIEQNLSTFSSHLRNLVSILTEVNPQTLVLIDELGAGTDPQEGAALGIALLRAFLGSGAKLVLTTHFGALKHYAYQHDELKTYSVDFDVGTLSPTYRLLPGVGASNAFVIAERLGLSSQIIADARHFIAEGAVRAEEIIRQLQEEHRALAEERARLRIAVENAERTEQMYQEQRSRIEADQHEALSQELRSLHFQLKAARHELEELLHRARTAKGEEALQAELKRLSQTAQELAQEERKLERPIVGIADDLPLPAEMVKPGVPVRLAALNGIGVVRQILDQGRVEVEVAGLRVQAKLADLRVAPSREGRASIRLRPAAELIAVEHAPPPLELHVRGLTVSEALSEVERYIDQLLLADRNRGAIVHGKGTGTLRREVHKLLSQHPQVQCFTSAPAEEGGEGVTLFELS
jgi:DNA mismatch repair protein MutS2